MIEFFLTTLRLARGTASAWRRELRVPARNWRGTDLRDDDPADAQKGGPRSRMRASQTPSKTFKEMA
jgi:hypothetical protein